MKPQTTLFPDPEERGFLEILYGLSLLDPWATLVAQGHKTLETRSWGTQIRGRIAIHRSQSLSRDARHAWKQEAVRRKLCIDPHLPVPAPQPGALIAVATLTHVWSMCSGEILRNLNDPEETRPWPTGDERLFGIYAPGRFVFELHDVQILPEPIPVPGKLRLFRLTPTLRTTLARQIESPA